MNTMAMQSIPETAMSPIDASAREKLASLFQPDILLSVQYLETVCRKTSLEPEKKLMLAVLKDAIDCFQRYAMARDIKGKALFREAEEWVLEEDGDGPFSFETICEVFRLNPSYVRRGLVRWKDRRVTKHPKAQNLSLTGTPERDKCGAHKVKEDLT